MSEPMDEPVVPTREVLHYDSEARRWPSRWEWVAWVGCWVYPLLPVGGLYAAWVVAWVTLGHPPRPNLDDPKGIEGIFEIFYVVGMLALMTVPMGIAGLVGGVVFTPKWVHERGWGAGKGVLIAVGMIAFYGVALFLLVVDPVGALGWIMD